MSDYIKVLIAILILAIILGFLAGCSSEAPPSMDGRVYNCDVKHLTLRTKILVTKGDETIGEITGNVIRFITDPLKMTKDGETIAFADDDYNFINQDDHAIVVDGEYQFTMHGGFAIFGETYTLLDASNNQIGYMSFNTFDTAGTLYNMDDEIIATYSSSPFFDDYTVTIYSDEFNDNALLLIFASYYSDQDADSSSAHHSSSSSRH